MSNKNNKNSNRLIKVGPLNHASKFFYTKSNLITAFLSISLFTIYLLLFLTNKAKAFEVVNSSTKSLGTTIGFGKDEIIAFFVERSDQMINSYITFNQIWDSLFALIYAIMYVILLSIVYKPYLIKAKLINLLPFTQLLFDWLENLSLATLSRQFLADETISTSTSLFASTTSSIKWMVSILVYALLLVGTIMRLKGLLKRSRI